jgi:hypothetical protein
VSFKRFVECAPVVLRVRTGRGESAYQLAPDLVALHGVEPGPDAVAAFEDEGVTVEEVERVSEPLAAERLGPVYRQPGGALVVPTGRAFVQFAQGERADRYADERRAAGFELEEVPSYAPHAAWVRPAGGGVVEGLQLLERLQRLPGVESVEPQLLSRAARRS